MSEDEISENALVPVKRRPFLMPKFKGHKDHMQNVLEKLLQSSNLDVKTQVEKEVDRAFYKYQDAIIEGQIDVPDDQRDFEQINARIVAQNKKAELERKIKHMGIHEGVLRKEEMHEKLRLLNENIKHIEND